MNLSRKGTLYSLLILLAAFLPLLIQGRYYTHIFIICLIYIIIANALNLVVGFTGYISFAHNAFYGLGAYASALLMQKAGLSFWVSMPLAVIIAGLGGFLVGYLPLRVKLKGPYFALVTMAFGLVLVSVIHNWVDLTGGPKGLTGIDSPNPIFGISFDSHRSYYYLTLFFVLLTLLFIWRLMNSKIGRAFISIREDEDMAEAIGINVGLYKIVCFVISASLTGLAGSLYAHYTRFLGPDMFTIFEAVDMLTMVIIGGMGTIVGPVLGAIIIVVLPEVLRGLAEYRQVIFSIVLILTIMFMPQGIVGVKNVVNTFFLNRKIQKQSRLAKLDWENEKGA